MDKFVLFDLDGTVTDPELGITRCVDYALRHFGIETEELSSLRKFIGPPLLDSFMDFYGFDKSTALEAVAKYRERFSITGIFENHPYSGIHQLLSSLNSAGYTLAIASSKPEIYTKQIIEHFELSPYFAEVCGSELDGRRTDKAEVITYAMQKLGAAVPENTIMIGDRRHDIIGARKNGLTSIGVLYGFGSETELREAGADHLASTVEDIFDIVKSIF